MFLCFYHIHTAFAYSAERLNVFEVRDCVECSVNYWVACGTYKRGFVEITFMSTGICLALGCLLMFCIVCLRCLSFKRLLGTDILFS